MWVIVKQTTKLCLQNFKNFPMLNIQKVDGIKNTVNPDETVNLQCL